MAERIFITGNEAVGYGAVNAGCAHFFGYPITPQNEITAWFAREMPKRGGVFVQSQSETGSINMVQGASAAGVRVMTSTSSPGWSLMQEGMSFLAFGELPAVIVLVQRGGPGTGTMRHAQMDYLSATRGGGHGGYKTIVFAPASAQEIHDIMQLAFYLADKYRNPVVVLSDGILGQMREPVKVETFSFPPLPEKDWAITGKAKHKDGKFREGLGGRGMIYPAEYIGALEGLDKKYQQMADTEVKFEQYQVEDAELLLVAFGYVARVCREVVNMARSDGLKIGLIRPITLWPFPFEVFKKKAANGARFLVVEDSLGQMIDDVRSGVEGQAGVNFLGIFARHLTSDLGIIFPDRVLEEVKRLLEERR